MAVLIWMSLSVMFCCVYGLPAKFKDQQHTYPFYSRKDWDALPATFSRPLDKPVSYVVIHHTYIPGACYTFENCKASIKSMQNYHISLDWGDIGYNFCVGSEGGAYEGRGWDVVGIHAMSANNYSIGISLIGDWRESSFENEVQTLNFPFIRRSQWNARQPLQITPLKTPVPYVVIHHSQSPAACYTDVECRKAMRSMQNFHMDVRGWWDIGYNFGVGSNGVAYEGRGWERLGAHALHFNTVSIGVCLIGDWTKEVPPAEQIKTTQALIAAGVEMGYIRPDFKLVGHRQVRETECPGDALFDNIKTWGHFSPYPRSHEDLKDIRELTEHFVSLKNSTVNS